MSGFNIMLLGLMTIFICGCQWLETHPEQVKEAGEIVEEVAKDVIESGIIK